MFGNPFYISFPGLGIAPFEMNKVAFSLFGHDIVWYGVLICTGMILAILYASRRFKKEGLNPDDLFNILLLAIPLGVIGARVFYVLTSLDDYIGRPFLDWIAIWNGGIAIYGAVIAGLLCILIYCKARKLRLEKVLDALTPALLIGQIIGRWGNFCNGEAFGVETTLPWRMGLGTTETITRFVHPTFLYESLWNLALFLIIHVLLSRRKKFDGEIFCFYAAFYGIGRGFIEMLRTDSLYIGVFRISSVIGFLSFIVFGALLIAGLVRAGKNKAATTQTKPETGKPEDNHDPA